MKQQIYRWQPTSQVCSCCGFRWGKVDLSVRSILCLNCGAELDRDENASKNIEMVGMGHRHDTAVPLLWETPRPDCLLKRTGSDHKTTIASGDAARTVASCGEPSRIADVLRR
ncbi:zinc ribbon domain-containing protein [Sphaerospermopsis aphanizomenoides]|uniref:zinc ribbon domain-containing protein n=1 Tax=Sphaerospermopsis aphanizomenoides TaxID=459663 RepID=UPI002D7FEF9C|nr:zinc ribbon domain-containing protein [Sphaerospermopsis aphanizomenoides]